MGRPSDYSPETGLSICAELSVGKSLRQICSADEMPDRSTVFRWLEKHREFRDQYARAREAQTEYWADEILEIADDGSNDWMERQRHNGESETVVDHEHINRSRLRVDSRKWLMSKLAPKKYGDKVDLQHTGADGGPVQIERIERVIVKSSPSSDS
jgi:hypothetical protein